MIDFIKSFDCGIDKSLLINNQYLKFPLLFYPDTGEIENKNRRSEYNDILFSIFTSGKVGMKGSLHKYFNNGVQNYNDFYFHDLIITIKDLYNRFGINPQNVIVNNIEFGVNLELSYSPQDFIDGLVTHRYRPFSPNPDPKIFCVQAMYSNFVLKIYDKGLQYRLNKNLMRIEIKVLRMAYLSKTGIKTLWDLTDRKKLNLLKEVLIDAVDDVLFCEEIRDETKISDKDLQLLKDGSNPKFWAKHLKETGKNASIKMRKFKNLTRNHGNQQFHLIVDCIKRKWDSLLEADSETVGLLTEFQNNLTNHNLRVLTETSRSEVSNNLCGEGEEDTTIYTSSKVVNSIHPINSKNKVCPVTGIDISMQKEESRFLSIVGIRYLYNNNRRIFDKLLSELPQAYHNESLKVQEYKIAHHVRDKFFNPRNRTRRAVRKICSEPALFDNMSLISKDKLEIANTP